MNLSRWLIKLLIVAALAVNPLPSSAGIFVSVGIAPPPLPVYDQPVCPDDGYLWTPGYWAYGPYGYYWVPGVWVQPPGFGVLWTPGYWGWGDGGGYFFHQGYWGPHVGFYGGINYGFGYGGNGYGGGRWNGNHFFYNTAVNHVDGARFHNTYEDRTTIINNNTRNVSFNGGTGGVAAQPTAQERQYSQEHHVAPTSVQQAHIKAASTDRSQLASVNGGRPATLAAARPTEYSSVAHQHATSQPLTQQDRVKSAGAKSAGAQGAARESLPAEKPATHAAETSTTESHAHATPGTEEKTHTSATAVHHTESTPVHHTTSTPVHHTSAPVHHTAAAPQHHAAAQSHPKPQGHPDDKKK